MCSRCCHSDSDCDCECDNCHDTCLHIYINLIVYIHYTISERRVSDEELERQRKEVAVGMSCSFIGLRLQTRIQLLSPSSLQFVGLWESISGQNLNTFRQMVRGGWHATQLCIHKCKQSSKRPCKVRFFALRRRRRRRRRSKC